MTLLVRKYRTNEKGRCYGYLKKIYGFDDFTINFSYPKKIVNSSIEAEHLKDRERFCYKKAIILMGQMQQEKLALEKHFSVFLLIWRTECYHRFLKWFPVKTAIFCIDFVNEDYRLQRL